MTKKISRKSKKKSIKTKKSNNSAYNSYFNSNSNSASSFIKFDKSYKKFLGLDKSKKSKKSRQSRQSKKTEKSALFSYVDKDNYLQSVSDFKDSKLLSYGSSSSDLKSFTINDIILEKPIYNKMVSICKNKLEKYQSVIEKKDDEYAKTIKLNKSKIDKVCGCLLDKNKNLTVNELEKLTKSKHETPGSKCVLLL
jgi:hypothetical protein